MILGWLLLTMISPATKAAEEAEAEQEKPPFLVEGIHIDLPFEEAGVRLIAQGYQKTRENKIRNGVRQTYTITVRVTGSKKVNTVMLEKRRLDMSEKLAWMQLKLDNPTAEQGMALERTRLIRHFGDDTVSCRSVGRQVICEIGYQCGAEENKLKVTYKPAQFIYTIEKVHLDNLEQPIFSPHCGGGGGTSGTSGPPPVEPPVEPVPTPPPTPTPTPTPTPVPEPAPDPAPEDVVTTDGDETAESEPTSAQEQFELAQRYESGDGVSQSDEKAAELYQKAAEQGHAGAQYNLAVKLETGDGIPPDQAQALENFRKSAEQDNSDAQFALGKHYLTGTGVEQNDAEAFEWIKQAAEQGHIKAQILLAGLFENGIGTDKDMDLAKFWYDEANKQDLVAADGKLTGSGDLTYPMPVREGAREENASRIPYD
jgi:hypothetical protein